MLDIFRKHAAFLLIVALAIFVGFTFWGDPNRTGASSSNVKAGKKTYSNKEIRKVYDSAAFGSGLGLHKYVGGLASLDKTSQSPKDDYVYNVLAIRQNKSELGIEISPENAIRNIPDIDALRDRTSDDIKNFLANRNISLNAVQELVHDKLSHDKVKGLLDAGIVPPTIIGTIMSKRLASSRTSNIYTVKGSAIDKKAIEVSDQEIKTYYDSNKDQFMSGQKRGLRYAYFQAPIEPASLADAPEEPIVSQPKNELPKPPVVTTTPETDTKAQIEQETYKIAKRAYMEKVQKFSESIGDPEKDFATVAKELDVSLKTVAPFTRKNSPKDLPKEVISSLFKLEETAPLSDPIKTKSGYYIVERLAVLPSAPITVEESEDEIRETLTKTKKDQQISELARNARIEIKKAIDENKNIDEIVTQLKLSKSNMAKYSITSPPDDPIQRNLVYRTESLKLGEVSEPVRVGNDYAIVHVIEMTELTENEVKELQKDIVEQSTKITNNLLLESWIHKYKGDIVFPTASSSQN